MNEETTAAERIVEGGMFSMQEASDFSRLGKTTLYDEMNAGRLAFVKHGRRRLIPRKALQKRLAENLIEATSHA